MERGAHAALAFGGSAGSIDALLKIFLTLPGEFKLPIITVCHLHPLDEGGLVEIFSRQIQLKVKEAEDKEQIEPGFIYFPPANYHLLVERDKTFALSVDAKVNYSRPSIDVFFESAAVAWGDELIGILLTGASRDGAAGIDAINIHGGLTIAQDPSEAVHPMMPQAAIDSGKVERILSITEIIRFLQRLSADNNDCAKKA